MAALTIDQIAILLTPYLQGEGSPELYSQLSTYLDLLLKWNARTNLTAIRDPEEIVRRHFGESLFAGRQLGQPKTLPAGLRLRSRIPGPSNSAPAPRYRRNAGRIPEQESDLPPRGRPHARPPYRGLVRPRRGDGPGTAFRGRSDACSRRYGHCTPRSPIQNRSWRRASPPDDRG